ncbi:MAG: hypothetical protein RL497_2071 [Pseudomonadota bacterium]|jgi:hypothetical protein
MAKGFKTGGREVGTPNKTTARVKNALLEAFEGAGSVAALTDWAKENPSQFYPLWAKLLPSDLNAEAAELAEEKEALAASKRSARELTVEELDALIWTFIDEKALGEQVEQYRKISPNPS